VLGHRIDYTDTITPDGDDPDYWAYARDSLLADVAADLVGPDVGCNGDHAVEAPSVSSDETSTWSRQRSRRWTGHRHSTRPQTPSYRPGRPGLVTS
jgi:hypothetical protein